MTSLYTSSRLLELAASLSNDYPQWEVHLKRAASCRAVSEYIFDESADKNGAMIITNIPFLENQVKTTQALLGQAIKDLTSATHEHRFAAENVLALRGRIGYADLTHETNKTNTLLKGSIIELDHCKCLVSCLEKEVKLYQDRLNHAKEVKKACVEALNLVVTGLTRSDMQLTLNCTAREAYLRMRSKYGSSVAQSSKSDKHSGHNCTKPISEDKDAKLSERLAEIRQWLSYAKLSSSANIVTSKHSPPPPSSPLGPDANGLESCTETLAGYVNASDRAVLPASTFDTCTTFTSEMSRRTCSRTWTTESADLVILKDDSNEIIGSFSIAFLQQGGGDTASIQYLLSACRHTLEIPPEVVLRLSAGHAVLDDDFTIVPGTYKLNGTFPPRLGPSDKNKFRPYRDSDSPSTVSNSPRSTTNQNEFKSELCLRDGGCLVTDQRDCSNLIACHIVPLSLGQDKLDGICGPAYMNLFSPQNGLLLHRHLHTAFDNYLWGIYVFEDSYIVHVFGLYNHSMHGKRLTFRTSAKSLLPNKKLLNWHYAQCLMARFRGRIVSVSRF